MRRILVCLWVCAAAPALAVEPETACPLPPTSGSAGIPDVGKQVLDELVGWIALHTSYDVSTTYRDPPAIAFCDIGETIRYEGADLMVDKALRAAYDAQARRIHIVLPWTPADIFDRSVLLHELIHDVQLLNREWECIGAPEWEAYQLQDLWLREHGIAHDFDWPVIFMLSRCP